MSSENSNDFLDLEKGLPVSKEDIEALRQNRPKLTNEEYLRWVATIPPPSYEELERRPGPARGPPFTLP